MPIPERRRFATTIPNLEWLLTDDGSRTLFDSGLNETFHSGCGAVAETLVVYLQNSGVVKRLSQQQPTSVLEFGLGTATGFLLTAALAEQHQTKLNYQALEKSLLPLEIFRTLNLPQSVAACLAGDHARTASQASPFCVEHFAALPRLANTLWQLLADLGKTPMAGPHQMAIGAFVDLTLVIGDARDYPGTEPPIAGFDAIYFDAFSPESNPDLWTPAVFQRAADLLLPGGSLTSYCVKSSVRRMIEASGLRVARVAGPLGGKREVLVAHKPEE